jgi:hypothetical protein
MGEDGGRVLGDRELEPVAIGDGSAAGRYLEV